MRPIKKIGVDIAEQGFPAVSQKGHGKFEVYLQKNFNKK